MFTNKYILLHIRHISKVKKLKVVLYSIWASRLDLISVPVHCSQPTGDSLYYRLRIRILQILENSSTNTELYNLAAEAHVCEWLAKGRYMKVELLGVEPHDLSITHPTP